LRCALESLEAQAGAPPFEAIVVDNGSTDATAQVVREAAARCRFEVRALTVPEPNRSAARNAGIETARGEFILFADDDVWLPPAFLAAHAAAQSMQTPVAVSGPILNVAGYDVRPKPSPLNYSGAFFCTCNVSIARTALLAVGGFDETFNLYGWEDTELGLRLRRSGVQRAFAWDAYLWHIKPPRVETLESVLAKTVERAEMAARFLRKDTSLRTKLATGAYGFNFARSSLLVPGWAIERYRRLATSARAPAFVRAIARAQFLDGSYTAALRRALAERAS
jgi:glycosyltransferase involved in cell wall biosynthesis